MRSISASFTLILISTTDANWNCGAADIEGYSEAAKYGQPGRLRAGVVRNYSRDLSSMSATRARNLRISALSDAGPSGTVK